MKISIILPLIAATALLGSQAGFAKNNSSVRFTATLEGANEVGVGGVTGVGDLDGVGSAVVRINRGSNKFCYLISVSGIAPATMAHIHEAVAGTNGPVVVPLSPPTNGRSAGCVSITEELANGILADPSEYYVNIHNSEFPGGALRGQLGE